MGIVYITLFFLSLFGIRFHGFHEGYISRSQTAAIKGLFVVMVFCRHFGQYISLGSGILDKIFLIIDSRANQLIVVMFFFYSGFGIMKKLLNDEKYIKNFLTHRFIPLWMDFAVCIVLFVITDTIMGTIHDYSLSRILLSFVGWKSIGNSNWFICVTFIFYILLLICFRCFKFRNIVFNLTLFSFMTLICLIILFFVKEPYFWNTMLCFPLGMWFGLYQEKVELLLKGNNFWISLVLITILLFSLLVLRRLFFVEALLFAVFVILVSMKIEVGNGVLYFLGNHVFSIYILQRIPMIFLKDRINNLLIYFTVTFTITLIMALVFDAVSSMVKGRMIKKN